MPRYVIIGVEGPHDLAFVSKLLSLKGFQRYDGVFSNLDHFWLPFVPKYPKGGQLYVRLDMPAILFTEDISVAIYAATGTNLRTKFPATFVVNPQFKDSVSAFGVIADSDDRMPADVATDYATAFRPHFPHFPNVPGTVDLSVIRTGIFVLPDNLAQGTIETILLECADTVYPDLKARAEVFLDGVDRTVLRGRDLDEISAPFGPHKAHVGTIVNFLKPGKTTQVSIQDNRWLEKQAVHLPKVAAINAFIDLLLNLP